MLLLKRTYISITTFTFLCYIIKWSTILAHPSYNDVYVHSTPLKFKKSMNSEYQRDTQMSEFDVRPHYHFLPQKNWMNDPNGPVFFNGVYHLFFQYRDDPTGSGITYWGHTVSPDLVYWKRLPVAISPTSGSYDEGGIWSGSATILDNHSLIVSYTGVCNATHFLGCEVVCFANPKNISDPFLLDWVKSERNPIIPHHPKGFNVAFRDPTTAWKEEEEEEGQSRWYFLVGSGMEEYKGGAALLYTSDNFFGNWTYVHPFATSSSVYIEGAIWECPDFYSIPKSTTAVKPSTIKTSRKPIITTKNTHQSTIDTFHNKEDSIIYVLKASCELPSTDYALGFGEHYWIGLYNKTNQSFTKHNHSAYDYGNKFYASKSFSNENGERILWGWIQEDDSKTSYSKRGWAGVQSLPRVVSYSSTSGLLNILPIPQLQKLRKTHHHIEMIDIPKNTPYPLSFGGTQMELLLNLRFNDLALDNYALAGIAVLEDTLSQRLEFTSVVVSGAPSPIEQNMNRPGNTFNKVEVDEINASEECRQKCRNTELCQAWSLKDTTCSLKTPIPDAVHTEGYISGLNSRVMINRTYSSLAEDANKKPQGGAIITTTTTTNREVELHIFIDHSVIEVFVNKGAYRVTARVYPTLASSTGLSLISNSNGVTLLNLDAWELASIW